MYVEWLEMFWNFAILEISKIYYDLSNMQKITCAAFDGYSLMMASYYQILHKLFFSS